MNRPTGITFLGILYILAGIAWISIAGLMGLLSSNFMGNSMMGGIAAIGGFVTGIAFIVAIIEFGIAGALLGGKSWGRTVVIVLVIIDLIIEIISIAGMNVFAIGFIVLDLIVLYYMWRPHVMEYFKTNNHSRSQSKFRCNYCGFPAVHYVDIKHHMQLCSKKPNSTQEDNLKNIGILKERLAKGEISKEEYDELKKEFS